MATPNETITHYFDAIRRKDAAAWVACFAPDSIAHDPAHAPARRGREAHGAFFEGVAGLFAELDFRPGEPYVCGDRAAVAFAARCVAGNGQTVAVAGIDVFQFDADGRIQRVDGYWDPTPLFAAAATTG
jgi:ketosteroid isomerase-like protein